jgi:hypothetical protein
VTASINPEQIIEIVEKKKQATKVSFGERAFKGITGF